MQIEGLVSSGRLKASSLDARMAFIYVMRVLEYQRISSHHLHSRQCCLWTLMNPAEP